ncbi:unnamed protein product [Caenorhabditis angaria]|uniref:Kelch repeat protein n=1 Tax=Caenorhabditis angaria TaxID=860376 RepID=A0A9P1N6Q5_9PELO|nr:unnamed protein product [Caenorhabditis angaria]
MARWTVHLEGGPRRVNHAAIAINSDIFSFGGYCSGDGQDQRQFIDVHVLDTTTYRWARVQHSNQTFNRRDAFLDVSIGNDADVGGEFSQKNEVPYQRYGHTVVGHNGKAYLWGGRNDDYGASNLMHEFDPVTLRWRKMEIVGFIPPARDGHTAVMVNNKMFVFGGFEEELQRFSQETYVFDFDTNRWAEFMTINTPPIWRDFHTAAAIDNKMYIFGGRSDQSGQVGDEHLFHSTNDIYDDKLMMLDLKTGKWSEVEVFGTAPGGRRSHSAWVYNQKMYMFGGYLGSKNIHYNELYCFEPMTSTWSIVGCFGEYPSARRRHCTVVVGNRVFLFGGTMPSGCGNGAGNGGIIPQISTSGLADLSDMHVLDYAPTLKQLALMQVLNQTTKQAATEIYQGFKYLLPLDVREEMYWMTTPNKLNQQTQQRFENFG